MPKFRLAVQLDFEIDVDPESKQPTSPDDIRKLAWRRLLAGTREKDRQVGGVKSRWYTQSFSPATPGVAEVVEVTPEMEAEPASLPRWRLVLVPQPSK